MAATTTTTTTTTNHDEPPSADLTALDDALHQKSSLPLILLDHRWQISTVSASAAHCMLADALHLLAHVTGDLPPPPSPIDAHHLSLARRFFSKTTPLVSIADYLARIHHHCAHSAPVYLAAAVFCHRMCILVALVPATPRSLHRLVLAAVRVAAKTLEDRRWAQSRYALVAGVEPHHLMTLEISLCFLLDWDLVLDSAALAHGIFALQQAARHAQTGGTFPARGARLALSDPDIA